MLGFLSNRQEIWTTSFLSSKIANILAVLALFEEDMTKIVLVTKKMIIILMKLKAYLSSDNKDDDDNDNEVVRSCLIW